MRTFVDSVMALLFVSFFYILSPANAIAEEIVLESNSYQSIIHLGDSVSANRIVIEREQIVSSHAETVLDLLSKQGNIFSTGTTGQVGSLYMRGGDSGHILILIDGVPFYDPSSIQRSTILDEINLQAVRRIEILKGSQSVVYGGQALAGVIKIETLPISQQQKKQIQLTLGNRDFLAVSASVDQPLSSSESGTQDEAQALLSLSAGHRKKMSASPTKSENYSYLSQTTTAQQSYVLRREYDYFLSLNEVLDRQELVGSDFTTYKVSDTKDFVMKNEQVHLSAGLSGERQYMKPLLVVGYQFSDKKFYQPVNDYNQNTQPTDEKYLSTTWTVRNQYELISSQDQHLNVGLDYRQEQLQMKNQDVTEMNRQGEQKGLFTTYSYQLSSDLIFDGGVRSEILQEQGRVESYQLGLQIWHDLKLQWATGFKAPSLYQLYSSYGNRDLLPEKSQTTSLSWDHQWQGAWLKSWQKEFSVALFDSHYSNLITTRSIGGMYQYQNVSKSQTQGIELASQINDEHWQLKVDLGYQEPRDIEQSRWLLRRPLQAANLQMQYTQNVHQWQLLWQYVGERLDQFSATTTGSLPSYSVWNCNYEYANSSQLKTIVSIKNILNNRFEQTRGYYDEGVIYALGLDLQM